MGAAALKATSNPRSSGGESQHLPQVPEVPSTDDEEIHSSSSSLALDAISAVSVSSASSAAEVPSSIAALTAVSSTTSASFSSNASVSSSSSAQVKARFTTSPGYSGSEENIFKTYRLYNSICTWKLLANKPNLHKCSLCLVFFFAAVTRQYDAINAVLIFPPSHQFKLPV